MNDYIDIECLLPDKYSNYKRLYYWDTNKKMIVVIYIDSYYDYIFYWLDPLSYESKVFIGPSYFVLHNQYGTLIMRGDYVYGTYHFDKYHRFMCHHSFLSPAVRDGDDVITINKDGHIHKIRKISKYEDDIVSCQYALYKHGWHDTNIKWKIPYDKFINPIDDNKHSGIYLYNNEVVTTLPVLKYDREGKGYINIDRLGYPHICKTQLITLFKCLYVLRVKSMVGLVRKLISKIYKMIYIMEGYLNIETIEYY
jgi:hypothetical protein